MNGMIAWADEDRVANLIDDCLATFRHFHSDAQVCVIERGLSAESLAKVLAIAPEARIHHHAPGDDDPLDLQGQLETLQNNRDVENWVLCHGGDVWFQEAVFGDLDLSLNPIACCEEEAPCTERVPADLLRRMPEDQVLQITRVVRDSRYLNPGVVFGKHAPLCAMLSALIRCCRQAPAVPGREQTFFNYLARLHSFQVLPSIYNFVPQNYPRRESPEGLLLCGDRVAKVINNAGPRPVPRRKHAFGAPARRIPVYINNRDRLTTTRVMVEYLRQIPGARPIVVDNASTYKPLLDWYKEEERGLEVIFLAENAGPLAPWKAATDLAQGADCYVVTDSDLDLTGVPVDVLEKLRDGLRRHPASIKAGLSIRIDDLPNLPASKAVAGWERQFWQTRLDDDWYDAGVDTTFAMYLAGYHNDSPCARPAIRSAPPYTARHVPWYQIDTEEERYVIEHADQQFSTWKHISGMQSSGRDFVMRRGDQPNRHPCVKRVAVVYDDAVRRDTTGVYCRKALDAIVETRHFRPSQLGEISPGAFDLFLCIDDGLRYELPRHLRPCAWWAIDTHLDFPWYRARCRAFDFVFVAQRDGAAQLRSEGACDAVWLPLACDPDLHRKYVVPKEFHVSFVGAPHAGERARLLDVIRKHGGNTFIGRRCFADMARTYSASLVVFNRSIRNNVNMRVFEAMACGSLLLTNDLTDNGQNELFSDGVHFATYADDAELLEKMRHYVVHDEDRERVAAAGRQEVVAKHTYRLRMETILETVSRSLSQARLSRRPGSTVRPPPAALAPPPAPAAGAADASASARKGDWGLTSIIVLTRNQLVYTQQCLNSVRFCTKEPYELIVVDNGSSDGTVEYLRAQDDVRLIANCGNRGFPAGCNQGINEARGEQIVLLNNDAIVTTHWLDTLLQALHSDPRIGIVGPCSNNVSGSQRVAACYEDLAGLERFAAELKRAHGGEWRDTERVVGFCLLMRRSLVDEIGLLDEQFGIGNFEDDDYCRRARLAGFRCLIARDAFVHHFGGMTHRGEGVDHVALLARNQQLFDLKWANGGQAGEAVRGGRVPPQDGRRQSVVQRSAAADGAEAKIVLSLCMIVRDNARTLDAALSSVAPWVDELIVVDTGSVDETPEIARKHGAHVYSFPWCDDFSAARNESIRHAGGEWVFWMDSDDTIDAACGRKLQALARSTTDPNVMAYVMQVHCPSGDETGATVVDHVKMFRNRPDLRFDGRIHEQILPAIRRAGGEVRWSDVFVRHSGSDASADGRKRKHSRDLRILQAEAAERPEHPFTLFNLGMTYADMRDFDRAADFLSRSILASPAGDSHVRKAYALLVNCLSELGRTSAAWEASEKGLMAYPHDAELLFRRGILAHRVGRFEDAERAYFGALSGNDERHFASIDSGIQSFKARHNLAVVYVDMGRLADAETQWQRAVREAPDFAAGWRGLGEVLVRQGKLQIGATEFGRLLRHPALRVEALLVMAKIAKAEGRINDCLALLEEAAAKRPEDVECLQLLCEVLFEHAEPARAEQALRSLCEKTPADAACHHNLGMVLLRIDKPGEAVAALETSIRLRPDAPQPYFCLSQALRQLGRTMEAEASIATAERLTSGAAGEAAMGSEPAGDFAAANLGA